MRLFAEKHGLDFEDFVKNGVDAEVLLATNDEMAKRAVEEAMKDG
jgi:predicted dinucleotide-binding enzyme